MTCSLMVCNFQTNTCRTLNIYRVGLLLPCVLFVVSCVLFVLSYVVYGVVLTMRLSFGRDD